jgi:hypothetical protein
MPANSRWDLIQGLKGLAGRTQLYLKSGTWSILCYQLHVSASTVAIIRLALNLSRDYTICMVCS